MKSEIRNLLFIIFSALILRVLFDFINGIEIHYEEIISVQETNASMASLLPCLNFNAAWTHSSNDYLMNKTNFEYGSTMGANLLNIFVYPKLKKI